MCDDVQKQGILREQELKSKVDSAVFGLNEAFRVMPATVEDQLKISKLFARFPEVFQPFLSFMDRAAQAEICSSQTSSICEHCASKLSSTMDLMPGERVSSSDSKVSKNRCSAAMSSRDAENGSSSVNARAPKLFAVDSSVLARFEHRVVRIEFVLSVDPMGLRTILHLSPETDAADA